MKTFRISHRIKPTRALHKNTLAIFTTKHRIMQLAKGQQEAIHQQPEAVMIPIWARHRKMPGILTIKHLITYLAHHKRATTPNLGEAHIWIPILQRIRPPAVTRVCLLARKPGLEQQERALLDLEPGP